MSAVLDTLQRVRLDTSTPSLRAEDPNGCFRNLVDGSLVYATDVLHITIPTAGATLNFSVKINGEWSGYESMRWDQSGQEGDLCMRWFALAITGDEQNSAFTTATTPSPSVWRSN